MVERLHLETNCLDKS